MLIQVHDGAQLLEARECRLADLADGRRAAIYQGLAFPLLESGPAIDVSREGYAAGLLRSEAAPRPANRTYAVIIGAEGAYVLIAGSSLQADRAAARLREDGFEVLRTGRYLGDPMDGFVPDWFVRIATHPQGGRLEETLDAIFGAAPPPVEGGAALRLRLLADELASARDRARRSEAELGRLLAARDAGTADLELLRARIAKERHQRETAEAEAAAIRAQLEATPSSDGPALHPPPRAVNKVRDEIKDVLDSLLPRIRLVGDGLDTAAVEFRNRRTLYRVLGELQACSSGMPPRWKSVQGADGWIEHSKVGNGQDDQGRVYAKLVSSDRHWDVLVSQKSTQDRDIAWLKRR